MQELHGPTTQSLDSPYWTGYRSAGMWADSCATSQLCARHHKRPIMTEEMVKMLCYYSSFRNTALQLSPPRPRRLHRVSGRKCKKNSWLKKFLNFSLKKREKNYKTDSQNSKTNVWLYVYSVIKLCLILLWPHGHQDPLSMNFPGKNTGVGWHFLLQGIFPTQGSNRHLLHWQADSLPYESSGKSPNLWLPKGKRAGGGRVN